MGRRAALVRDPCAQSSAQLAFLIPNAKSLNTTPRGCRVPSGTFFDSYILSRYSTITGILTHAYDAYPSSSICYSSELPSTRECTPHPCRLRDYLRALRMRVLPLSRQNSMRRNGSGFPMTKMGTWQDGLRRKKMRWVRWSWPQVETYVFRIFWKACPSHSTGPRTDPQPAIVRALQDEPSKV